VNISVLDLELEENMAHLGPADLEVEVRLGTRKLDVYNFGTGHGMEPVKVPLST